MGITIHTETIRPGVKAKSTVSIPQTLEQVEIFFNSHSAPMFSLKDLLSNDFILGRKKVDSSRGDYYSYKVRPFIEVLFVHDPVNFLHVFNKAKENPEHRKQFIQALEQSDLRVLSQPWKKNVMIGIIAGMDDLDLHYRTLLQEKAVNEAENLMKVCEELDKIISPTIRHTAQGLTSPELDQCIAFAAILHTQDAHMQNHRAYWKVILGNILLGILGVGVFYGLAVLCNNGNTFFGQTDRQKKINNLHNAIHPELPRQAL